MAALRWQPLPTIKDSATFTLEDVPLELSKTLARDIDTPGALAFLSQVTTQLLSALIESDMVDNFEAMLGSIDDLLGLQLLSVEDISSEQKQLVTERQAARDAQDWAKSDDIRDQLASQGVGLRDTPNGPIWFPLT